MKSKWQPWLLAKGHLLRVKNPEMIPVTFLAGGRGLSWGQEKALCSVTQFVYGWVLSCEGIRGPGFVSWGHSAYLLVLREASPTPCEGFSVRIPERKLRNCNSEA